LKPFGQRRAVVKRLSENNEEDIQKSLMKSQSLFYHTIKVLERRIKDISSRLDCRELRTTGTVGRKDRISENNRRSAPQEAEFS
jgi:esterase/lipase